MVGIDFTERDIKYFESLETEISCPCTHVFTKVTLVTANPAMFHINCSKCGTYLTRAMLYKTRIR